MASARVLLESSDYDQIHLTDRDAEGTPAAWHLEHAASRYLAPDEDGVAVATGVNGYVTVAVEVVDQEPAVEDTVVSECSVRVGSGELVLSSPTSPVEEGPVVRVPAGWVRVRVGLAWWPEALAEPRVELVDTGELDGESIPPYLRGEHTSRCCSGCGSRCGRRRSRSLR